MANIRDVTDVSAGNTEQPQRAEGGEGGFESTAAALRLFRDSM